MSAESPTAERAELPAERGFFGRMATGTAHSIRLLCASKSGMVGLFILVFFTLIAIFGPLIAPQDPAASSSYSSHILAAPSSEHLARHRGERARRALAPHPRHAHLDDRRHLGGARLGRDRRRSSASRPASSAVGSTTVLTAIDDWFLVIPFLPLAIVLVSLLGPKASDLPFGSSRS